MTPLLILLRPLSEVTDDLSKLARYLQGWGLIDLPLRASNEGLLRPRVARAQKIIRLHPFPPSDSAASASKKDGLATPFPLFAKSWDRFVKPGAPQGLFH